MGAAAGLRASAPCCTTPPRHRTAISKGAVGAGTHLVHPHSGLLHGLGCPPLRSIYLLLQLLQHLGVGECAEPSACGVRRGRAWGWAASNDADADADAGVRAGPRRTLARARAGMAHGTHRSAALSLLAPACCVPMSALATDRAAPPRSNTHKNAVTPGSRSIKRGTPVLQSHAHMVASAGTRRYARAPRGGGGPPIGALQAQSQALDLDAALQRERAAMARIAALEAALRAAGVAHPLQASVPRVAPAATAPAAPAAPVSAAPTSPVDGGRPLSPISLFDGVSKFGPKAFRYAVDVPCEPTCLRLDFRWEPTAVAIRVAALAWLHHLYQGARSHLQRIYTAGAWRRACARVRVCACGVRARACACMCLRVHVRACTLVCVC